MACSCSQINKPSAKYIFAYTMGCEADFYYLLRTALPEPKECGLPVVHPDGSIEYPQGDPPSILGYEKSERIFRPIWPSCRWRTLRVTHVDGCFSVEGQCNCPKASTFLNAILPEQCKDCPTRTPIND